jgi:hypothetical protein
MQNALQRNHRLLFYSAWALLSIIQASNTELFDDESYYWVYSRFIDWGYFDHPPMIAALVKAGYAIFHNELGVRLFVLILNTATIFFVQQLTYKKDDTLFYAIAGSIAVAQVGGIIAVPDTPLLFFVVLFFWLYQRFLQYNNITSAILLGVCMACMLYSKYHGVLVIGLVLLSNLKLFANKYTYVSILVCLGLFVPHIYWQYRHNFPSVQFHLFERNAATYKFKFTTEYLLGQVAFAGPVIGWFLLWAAFTYKPVSPVERAMKYTMIGTYIAFLISTYKGRVEANWTVAALIPLMVLSHRYFVQNYQLKKWVYRSIPITILLIVAIRLYIMSWFPPVSWIKRNEFHGNREWATEMHNKAGNLPVVFVNTYQMASKYWFYSGTPAFSLNSPYYRRNNYNLWPVEDSLIGKPVYIDVPDNPKDYEWLFKPNGWPFPKEGIYEGFFSFSRVLFTSIKCTVWHNGSVQINTNVFIPENYKPYFQQPTYSETPIWLVLYDDGEVKTIINTGSTVRKLTGCGLELTVSIPVDVTAKTYNARLCIGSVLPGFPTINSTGFELCLD